MIPNAIINIVKIVLKRFSLIDLNAIVKLSFIMALYFNDIDFLFTIDKITIFLHLCHIVPDFIYLIFLDFLTINGTAG